MSYIKVDLCENKSMQVGTCENKSMLICTSYSKKFELRMCMQKSCK